jgi:hypothetical protein
MGGCCSLRAGSGQFQAKSRRLGGCRGGRLLEEHLEEV